MRRRDTSGGQVEGAIALGLGLGLGAALLGGCGSAPQKPPTPASAPVEVVERRHAGPTFESEIGALDEGKVKAAFLKAATPLGACFNKGAERVPFLAGEVRFKLRIAKSGSVRWVFVKDSTLGDRATEDCMLAALKGMSWPSPVGGEGLAENSFNFEPGGDDRPPVPWKPEQLGKAWKGAKAALAQCRRSAGAGPLKATLYVDPEGKATAVGVAGADEKGEAAAPCVVSALQAMTFPSPGSYASKVSVSVE